MKQKSQDHQMLWDRLIPWLDNVENVTNTRGVAGWVLLELTDALLACLLYVQLED